MAGNSYMTAAEEIRSRANIVDVISPLVSIKKAGSNYTGCCPFHKEKTPSFIVFESGQHYHCFGCGAHGDVIGFVMRYYDIGFREAVERLALQYGIAIDKYDDSAVAQTAVYYDANKKAATYYMQAFWAGDNPGMRYMQNRGIEPKTLKTFGIGYADDDWQSLTDHLTSEGVSEDILKELKLSAVSQKTGKLFDYFRGRVIFPIIDTRKRVIGFGGRIIGDGEPKYLNSSESAAFHKGSNLFALNLAKEHIQELGYAILVEGYMDVIGLYQYGVCNAVASLGTALTDNQAKLLKKYTKKVIICYDSDPAGIKAAIRGIDVLRPAGFEIRVMNVENAKDPDEFVKKFGRDAFLEIAEKRSRTDVDYKIALIGHKYDIKDTAQGVKFLKAVAGVLRGLSPVEQDLYIRKVAKDTGISEGALRREVTGSADTGTQTALPPRKQDAPEAPEEQKLNQSDVLLERLLIRISLVNSEYCKAFGTYPEAAVTREAEEIAGVMLSTYSEGIDFDPETLANSLQESAQMYLKNILNSVEPGDAQTAYEDCVNRLEIKRIEKRSEEIMNTLDLAGEDASADELMKEFSELQKKLKHLKGRFN